MYFGDALEEIELSPNFWEECKVENITLSHFTAIFNSKMIVTPSYIPQEYVKEWIDKLILKCPSYYKFIENFYTFKFKQDDKGNYYKYTDIRNPYGFSFFSFYDMIEELKDYYDIDLKLFMTSFNKMFRYYITDFSNYPKRKDDVFLFAKYTGIDLNNLNTENIIKLLNLLAKYPFSPEAVGFDMYGPIFYHDVENVFLQYWYEKQSSTKERIFSNERQMSWLDFGTYVIKELSDVTILEMVNMLIDVGITEHDLFNIRKYGEQYAEKILSKKKQYETLDDLFLDDRINECIDTIKDFEKKDIRGHIASKFKLGVYDVLKYIMDECKMIEMIIKLNELVITYIQTEDVSYYNKINEALNIMMHSKIGKTNEINKEFTSLTCHTHCMFIQICISVIDNPNIHPFMKSIAERISVNCSQCEKYFSCINDGNKKKYYVYCEHRTIHYYTFTRWWYMYMGLIEKFYNKKYKDMTLQEYYQNSFQVWYPKSSYCDVCYTQYKNLEEIINNKTKGLSSFITKDNDELRGHKFLMAVMKSKAYKYRMLYNEHCDIPIASEDNNLIQANISHKAQIVDKTKSFSSALADFLKSIQEEILTIAKLYDSD